MPSPDAQENRPSLTRRRVARTLGPLMLAGVAIGGGIAEYVHRESPSRVETPGTVNPCKIVNTGSHSRDVTKPNFNTPDKSPAPVIVTKDTSPIFTQRNNAKDAKPQQKVIYTTSHVIS